MKHSGNIFIHMLFERASIPILLLVFGLGCSSPLEEEKDVFNLRIYPSTLQIAEGEEKFVSVWVDHADGLIAARFTLSFDPSVVEVDSVWTSGTDFVFSNAGANVIEVELDIDNEKGMIVVGIGAQKEGFRGIQGGGLLADIKIRAKSIGETHLTFVDNKPDDIVTAVYAGNTETGWTDLPVEMFNGVISVVTKSEQK